MSVTNRKIRSFPKTVFYFLLILLLSLNNLAGQKAISIGLNAGVTVSSLSSILETDDGDASTDMVGKGKTGIKVGAFMNLPVSDRWILETSLGYEQLNFDSFNPLFEESTINHLIGNVLSVYNANDWIGAVLGLEVMNRSSTVDNTSSALRLNGLSVKGAYWQAIAGLRLYYKDIFSIDAQLSIPRIKSVTRTFEGLPSDNRLIVERLQAFRISINVPIMRKTKS